MPSARRRKLGRPGRHRDGHSGPACPLVAQWGTVRRRDRRVGGRGGGGPGRRGESGRDSPNGAHAGCSPGGGSARMNAMQPTIVVRGEVIREVPPELAVFNVSVTARGKNKDAVLARLTEQSAVLRA